MEVQIISDKFMILKSPADELICGDALNKFIHKTQKDNAMLSWNKIHAEIYSSGKENLYFIYPDETKIYLAGYAIPFLGEYFTD